MRKYEYNGKIESLKTLPTEITVEEFKNITKNQDHVGNFMYYLNAFEILGLSSSFIDDIDDVTLYEIIADFQEDFKVDNTTFKKIIEVDGYEYAAYDENFSLGARDIALIEEEMHKDPVGWITYALAIIFKRTDLSPTEHKASAHIKHKKSLFKNVTLDIALPYIIYISNSYIDNVKLISGM